VVQLKVIPLFPKRSEDQAIGWYTGLAVGKNIVLPESPQSAGDVTKIMPEAAAPVGPASGESFKFHARQSWITTMAAS